MTKSLNLLKSNSIPKYASKQESKTLNLTINELRNFMVDYIKAIYDQIDSHKIEEVKKLLDKLMHYNATNLFPLTVKSVDDRQNL
ncbi:hypothetical protein BpHYR1_024712 [Brachionus plicatilis]|uniref:Uncharacterized protein n=1 Tax=Brachionus plicatilis TaxID=10195 RepID=A0A3M7QDB0_BRAPC|nr:hypothetical protein BpHYR1_024712 [Brachionus plicatilis]